VTPATGPALQCEPFNREVERLASFQRAMFKRVKHTRAILPAEPRVADD
jgi:hypothetical protein